MNMGLRALAMKYNLTSRGKMTLPFEGILTHAHLEWDQIVLIECCSSNDNSSFTSLTHTFSDFFDIRRNSQKVLTFIQGPLYVIKIYMVTKEEIENTISRLVYTNRKDRD